MFGVRYLHDERTGGDIRFNKNLDKLTTNYYGIGLNTNRVEVFTKTSLNFPGYEYKSLGLQLSYIHHEQEGYFGLRNYDAYEQTFYSNLIFQNYMGDSRYKFRTGISMMADTYHDHLDSLLLSRNEIIPGGFFEFTWTATPKMTIISGIRADHNSEYGWFVNPRLHFQYRFNDNQSIRASLGSGHHAPHILAENTSLPASSRKIVIARDIDAEHAWNTGLNYSYSFLINGQEARFTADAYRTWFTNQTVVDLYTDPYSAYIYNLYGKSYSNSLQTELSYEVIANLKVKAAWKFNDVKMTYNNHLMEKPLNPRHRALLNIAYETPNGKWKADFTLQYTGVQSLPSYILTDNGYEPDVVFTASESPDFWRSLGQITYMFGNWDIYIGSENIGDYRQYRTVIGADDPFGKDFDTGIVWGPVTGRMLYAGIRFKIK